MIYESDGHPFEEDKDPRSILRWFERGSTSPTEGTERVIPEGPATFVVGDRWITVPRGSTRFLMVEPGTVPRLATGTDVLAQE